MTTYRLAALREARLRDERVGRGDLAAALDEAGRSAAAVARAEARVAQLTADLAALGKGAGTARELLVRERYAARLRRDREAARAEAARAEAAHAGTLGAVDDAQVRLARARADKLAVERHFERWRDEQKKLAERRE